MEGKGRGETMQRNQQEKVSHGDSKYTHGLENETMKAQSKIT